MSRRSPFLLSRRALERLEREIRSSAAHRSGIGTWRFARVGWHWLPRRQRACPSAALDERVLAAIKVDRLPGRPSKHPRSARERARLRPVHAAGPVFSHHDFDPARLAAPKEADGLTASLCIPARDEATTIGRIVESARRRLVEAGPPPDGILGGDDHPAAPPPPPAAAAGAPGGRTALVLPQPRPGP